MASTIQVRVEDDLKKKSDELFKQLGTDTTSAIRMFLTQAILNNGFPFDIKIKYPDANPYVFMTEEELLLKLAKSKDHADQGKYKDAEIVISDMREKYGL